LSQPLREQLHAWLQRECPDNSAAYYNGDTDDGADAEGQAAGEGLTGIRPADIRALVDKTSGPSTAPGVVTLRNQALAAQAALVTCLALK
jgi:hypothetical protein